MERTRDNYQVNKESCGKERNVEQHPCFQEVSSIQSPSKLSVELLDVEIPPSAAIQTVFQDRRNHIGYLNKNFIRVWKPFGRSPEILVNNLPLY